MKKLRLALVLVATLITGFVIGFFRGEKIYSWTIVNFFHNTNNELDMSIVWAAVAAIGTILLGLVAVIQTSRANKIANKTLDLENEKAKRERLEAENSLSKAERERLEEENRLTEKKIALEKMIKEETICVTLEAGAATTPSESLNAYDKSYISDIFIFTLKNCENLIKNIKVFKDNVEIADSDITISPNTSKVFRIHLKDYKQEKMFFYLQLKGISNYITTYRLTFITEKLTKDTIFKTYNFIECRKDDINEPQ